MGRMTCTSRQPQTDVPPLKALKLWCLKKCSKHSSPPTLGLQVVESGTADTEKPAWMRNGNLDPTVWKELPLELLEHVLSYLPLPSLFRCSTVCKLWRNIAQSPQLRLSRATISVPWPSFCPLRYHQSEDGVFHWSGLSTDTSNWQDMPPISLPCSQGKSVWAGAGGLLVIYKPGSIFVCNPVTKQWRQLPCTIQKWSWPNVLHMIVDDVTRSYTVILAGTEAYTASKPQRTEVYHSDTGKWKVTGSLPTDLYLDTQDAALENGLLYCTAQKAYVQGGDILVGTDALVAYDVRRGVWTELTSELPDESARQTALVCAGRVVVAVAPVDDDGPVGCFYALNPTSRRWDLLASMPQAMHRRLRSWEVCFVRGNDVLVVGDMYDPGLVVSYDLVRRTWTERAQATKINRTKISTSKDIRLYSRHSFPFKDMRRVSPISFRPDVNALP